MSDAEPPDLSISDGYFTEQFPLSPLDDLMIHQTPDPVRIMWTGDPRAYERYWMVSYSADGQVLVATGGSIYPNLDRAEAYAIVVAGGRHASVRSFRPLGVDRTDMRVGPIAPRVLQGLRRWRYVLEANEQGIAYDLEFTDTVRQRFREPLSDSEHGQPPGRRNDVTTGFEGFGDVRGWVEIDGARIELGPGSQGSRDRHWGTGRGVGGPALALGGRLHVGTNGNAFVQFPDWTLWGDRILYRYGDQRGGFDRVGKPTRWLRFEPDTHLFAEAVVEYPLAGGERRRVHYERLGQQTAYLRCGMYGGTPEGDIHQGGYDGPPRTEGEVYDVGRPEVRTAIAGLDEHLCRVTWQDESSIGVYQTIDPLAYESCMSGRPGWNLL